MEDSARSCFRSMPPSCNPQLLREICSDERWRVNPRTRPTTLIAAFFAAATRKGSPPFSRTLIETVASWCDRLGAGRRARRRWDQLTFLGDDRLRTSADSTAAITPFLEERGVAGNARSSSSRSMGARTWRNASMPSLRRGLPAW